MIAGPPEDDPDLAAMIARSTVAPRIHLAGYVDDETLVGFYRGAECLLHPSRYEGFGFPPLEAMACAVPVIAARGTATEEVEGHAGVLVDADDVEGFAPPSSTCSARSPPGSSIPVAASLARAGSAGSAAPRPRPPSMHVRGRNAADLGQAA